MPTQLNDENLHLSPTYLFFFFASALSLLALLESFFAFKA